MQRRPTGGTPLYVPDGDHALLVASVGGKRTSPQGAQPTRYPRVSAPCLRRTWVPRRGAEGSDEQSSGARLQVYPLQRLRERITRTIAVFRLHRPSMTRPHQPRACACSTATAGSVCLPRTLECAAAGRDVAHRIATPNLSMVKSVTTARNGNASDAAMLPPERVLRRRRTRTRPRGRSRARCPHPQATLRTRRPFPGRVQNHVPVANRVNGTTFGHCISRKTVCNDNVLRYRKLGLPGEATGLVNKISLVQ